MKLPPAFGRVGKEMLANSRSLAKPCVLSRALSKRMLVLRWYVLHLAIEEASFTVEGFHTDPTQHSLVDVHVQ
jgi:hypothetical protein